MRVQLTFDEFLRQVQENPQRFEQMPEEELMDLLENRLTVPGLPLPGLPLPGLPLPGLPLPGLPWSGLPLPSLPQWNPLAIEVLKTGPFQGIPWDGRLKAFRAQSVQHVQTLVGHALHTGVNVRASGSRHSRELAYEGDSKGDLNLLLDGELRKVEFLEKGDEFARVRVGAGCYIGRNPSDDSQPVETTLSRVLDAAGYALPIVGGITHQSVAGFMQTGSSGGSLQHGFADLVEEIELVDGKGDVRVFRKGSDELNAIGVSMGLFGVITHVTLRVPRTFWVEGAEEIVNHSESLLTSNGSGAHRLAEALGSTEYLHLNWFPQKYVQRVMQWSGKRVTPTPTKQRPYKNILKNRLAAQGAQMVLRYIDRRLQRRPVSNETQMQIGDLLRMFVRLGVQPFCDSWYLTLPSDDEVPVDGGMRTLFTEVWLPVEETGEVLRILGDMLQDPVVAGNFAVELYGARHSPFWLSAAHDRDVIRVDPYWWAGNLGQPEQCFVHYWNRLMDVRGSRFHWGKYMPAPGQTCGKSRFDLAYLKSAYPRLDAWLELRRQLDPKNVFLTAYWRSIFEIR